MTVNVVTGSRMSDNEVSGTVERRVVFIRRRHAAAVWQHPGHHSVPEIVPWWSWTVAEQRRHKGGTKLLFVVNYRSWCQLVNPVLRLLCFFLIILSSLLYIYDKHKIRYYLIYGLGLYSSILCFTGPIHIGRRDATTTYWVMKSSAFKIQDTAS